MKIMKTIIEKIDKNQKNTDIIREAGRILKEGGLVAFPTETVYGLGADALNEDAAKKIYAAKGRPSDNPLIIHITNMKALDKIVSEVPEKAVKVAEKYWPGPLTMILPKADIVPKETTGGLDSVAVRFPSDRIAQELILAAGGYVAAPSANTSGRPSPTTAGHVAEDLGDAIDMIIDGGMVGMGLESTIIDVTVNPPMILRPGFITYEMVKEIVPDATEDRTIFTKPTKEFKPKAPGMKYRHYAPSADYTIYKGDEVKVAEKIIELANEKADEGKITGIITADQHLHMYQGRLNKSIKVVSLGDLEKPETVANHLFKALRDFDKVDTEFIFGEAFSEKNVGQAIMNRLTKAAGYNIIDV